MAEFREYCRQRSSEIEATSQDVYWLERRDGECSDEDYCHDCAIIQRYVERHKGTGFGSICGSPGCSFETDHQQECGRCGVALNSSLTKYGIEEEIRYLQELGPGEMTEWDCWIAWRFLDGYGCWDDDKHWQLLEPHVLRLMSMPAD